MRTYKINHPQFFAFIKLLESMLLLKSTVAQVIPTLIGKEPVNLFVERLSVFKVFDVMVLTGPALCNSVASTSVTLK